MSSVALPPHSTVLIQQSGRMTDAWYRYSQDQHRRGGSDGTFALWQNHVVPGTAMKADATIPPGFIALATPVRAWAFDASTNEALHFSIVLPNTWPVGTGIYPAVQWCPSDAGVDDVVWTIDYAWANNGEAFAATLATMTSTAPGVDRQHTVVVGDAIAGAGKQPTGVVACRIYRDAASSDDTYGADAFLLAAGFIIQNAAVGTVNRQP